MELPCYGELYHMMEKQARVEIRLVITHKSTR